MGFVSHPQLFCSSNWSRAISPDLKDASLSLGLCMIIAATGQLQSLMVVHPPTDQIARMTSPRVQERVLVNRAQSEWPTTNT